LITVIFIKILLGGIVNSENQYLVNTSNFGPDGALSIGDQASVVLGNVGLLLGLIIMAMIAVNLVCDVSWMYNFGKKANGIENLFRRKTNHKMFMFSWVSSKPSSPCTLSSASLCPHLQCHSS
jgi:hypothetical protein